MSATIMGQNQGPQWYCVRSRAKSEHIAAAQLRLLEDVEVYCPRLRFQKSTRTGPKWFTEALFPTYFFARFELFRHQKAVIYSQGVTGLVRFGDRPAVVPDEAVEEMRSRITGELHVIEPDLKQGDAAVIAGGAFHGLETVVTQVLPAKERVRVLVEFLGRTVEVELQKSSLLPEDQRRMAG